MSLPDDSARNSGPWRRVREFVDSLAGRLLGLTALAVIAGEIFVFAPALAGFHEGWLRERMNLGYVPIEHAFPVFRLKFLRNG